MSTTNVREESSIAINAIESGLEPIAFQVNGWHRDRGSR